MPSEQYSAMSCPQEDTFLCYNVDVHFVLYQHA